LSEVERYIEENLENGFRYIGDPTEREENKRKWVRMHRIMRDQQSIRNGELVDLLDVPKHWVSRRLSVWKKKQLIRSGPYGYQKTPKFVKWLRVIATHERFEWAFIGEENFE
jgi:hypothetical protein